MENNSPLVGTCPNCGSKVAYHEGDNSVTCYACDQIVNVRDLFSSSRKEDNKNDFQEFTQVLLGAIGSNNASMFNQAPDGQLAYLENVFEMLDWESYKNNSKIEFDDIKEYVNDTKLKYATDPNTWVLEFKSIAIPLNKKIEALKEIGNNLAEKYTGKDDTALFEHFDLYSRIVKNIIAKRDYYEKLLNLDVKNAEKYKADSKLISELKEEAIDVINKINELSNVSRIQEVPEVNEVLAAREAEYVNELRSQGINALETYNSAVESFMFDTSKEKALRLFNSIPKFRDSEKYIEHISRWFIFEDYCEVAGVGYAFLIQKKEMGLLNVKKPQNDPRTAEENAINQLTMCGIYEIKNGVPAKEPIVKDITQVLCAYNGKLFYIEKNSNVCVFDGITKLKTVVIGGKLGDFITNIKEVSLNSDGNKLFIKKKLDIKFNKAKGCFSKNKQGEAIVNLNNYSLIMIDLSNMNFSNVIDEMVDIIKISENIIFFKQVDNSDKKIYTYFYNCNNNVTKKINECEIDAVIGDKFIYSTYKPKYENKSLFVSDLTTGDTVLLEDNIYRFFKAVNEKVFYVVGSQYHTTLFSINLDGTDRKQIVTNVHNVIHVDSSWIYLLKGTDTNKVLVKLSLDGEKSYVVASAISKVIKTTSEYVYYIDVYENLHMVRNDGKNDKIISSNMTGSTIVDNSYIYFARVDEYYRNDNVVSLYKLDLNGRNIKKLAYDISDFKEYDDNSLLVLKDDYITIETKTPINKKEYNTTLNSYEVYRYYVINKYSDETKVVLTTGAPNLENGEIKVGCFKKKKVEYKEIEYVPEYNTNISKKAGNNFAEKSVDNQQSTNQQSNKSNKNSKGCQGCNSKAAKKR